MGKKTWQKWDESFKQLGLSFSARLIRWLGLAEEFSILEKNSPAKRVHERRPDLLIDFLDLTYASFR